LPDQSAAKGMSSHASTFLGVYEICSSDMRHYWALGWLTVLTRLYKVKDYNKFAGLFG